MLPKVRRPLEIILLASGSELQHALKAAEELGPGTRVVSMPCFERFERQDAAYRESVLPNGVRKRVSIEAGVADPWFRFVGLDGKAVSIDRFGMSAPRCQSHGNARHDLGQSCGGLAKSLLAPGAR